MAYLDFPSIVPETQEFGIRYNTQVATSDISGIVQTVELPGARWVGSLSFRDLTPSESSELKAFLLQMRGSAGRFFYGDNSYTGSAGNPSGTVTVTGTNRTVITVSGLSGEFAVGDYIQIGSGQTRELKMVIASANPQITIEPAIRMSSFSGQDVVYNNPVGGFMLTTSDQAKWAIRSKALLSDISLEFIEV